MVYQWPSLSQHPLDIAIRRIAAYTTGDRRDTGNTGIGRRVVAPGRESSQRVQETRDLRNPYNSNLDEGRIGTYSRAAPAGRTAGDTGSGLHHAWLLLPAVQIVAPSPAAYRFPSPPSPALSCPK